MAEGLLVNVVGEIITKVSSQAIKKLGMLWGVKDEITKLTNSASAIKAVLVDSEDQQSENASIKDWLQKLKHVFYDVEDVIDEFFCEALRREVMTRDKRAKEVCIFFSKSNQIAFAMKIAFKIKNVRKNLDAIAADRSKFHFTKHLKQKNSHISERNDTHSFIPEEEVVGRNDDKEKVKNHLLDMNAKQNISFIVIAGMGGLGKTTLAKFIYNDREVFEFFDLRMWVCISELFDVKMVVKNIIESATNSRLGTSDMESLQNQFRKVIQGKKYLLVLDDIWNENEEKWLDLKNLLMGGARGSKIVITKRDNKLVAEIADMTLLYDLKGLSEESSWSLFRKVAFKGGEEPNNPNLIKLGKEIVQKCKGIPLVIRSIGRALYFKTSEEEWMSFRDEQPQNDVMANLKLSYDHLPSSYLKQCFAYCSLFPKDYSIKEDEIIKQSIAQGFVESSNRSKSMEDTVKDYFLELCWRSMLQSSSLERQYDTGNYLNYFPSYVVTMDETISMRDARVYKMHDLMHDLAQMVASDEYKSINSEVDDGVNEKTRHISFDGELCSEGNLPTSLFKAKGLRTFLLQDNDNLPTEVLNESALDKLFSSFMRLRVLKLNASQILTVPKSINKLRHLRYLNLSGNVNLELLPNSITELQNLQTLDLHYCRKLKELPRDTSNLVNLRHLDLHATYLTHMPKGMGMLTSLQTLNIFVLDKKNDKHTSKLSELKGLNHLRGWLEIRGLKHLNSTPSEASLARLKNKKGLRYLNLQWGWAMDDKVNDEMVLEGLEPHPNVESLHIELYRGVRLSNWVSSLLKLTEIKIVECERLQHLPQFDQLPALKRLTLWGLLALEFIDNKDLFSSSVFFPSLQLLHLQNMPNLKGWWKWESIVDKHCLLPSFPPLTEMSIFNCPNLASMPLHSDLKYVGLYGVSLQTLELPIVRALRPARDSDPSSFITFSLFALEKLELLRIEDLEFLPEQLWQHVNNLESLRIEECLNFQVSASEDVQYPTSYLHDGNCKKLESFGEMEEEKDGMRGKLKALRLHELPRLVSLPIGSQHLTTLQSLYISRCHNFTHLPEWIGSLVSLEVLEINRCPKLKSLPEGMRQLKSLQTLWIRGCAGLKERCKQGGEDWPKIAHVPNCLIYGQ